MATEGKDSRVEIQIIHGTSRHQLTLEQQGDQQLTVADLAAKVEEVTEVPVNGQKLIFKGKSLKDHSATLGAAGVKAGSKVMLIGRKAKLEDDENYRQMVKVEESAAHIDKRLSAASDDLQGLEQGYLKQTQVSQTLSKTSKRLVQCTEEFTVLLEQLDSLELADAATEIKGKRKTLATKINKCLDMCDKLQKKVEEILAKTNS